MISVRVLSVKQPWATLIVRGVKRFEARTWPPNWRGRIAIHASSSSIPKQAVAELLENPDVAAALAGAGIRSQEDVAMLPKSAVIGAVSITDAHAGIIWSGEGIPDLDFDLSSWESSDILWDLSDPIECKPITGVNGRLNLWTLEENPAKSVMQRGSQDGTWEGTAHDDALAREERKMVLADYAASLELVERKVPVPKGLRIALGGDSIIFGDAFVQIFRQLFDASYIPPEAARRNRVTLKGSIAAAAFPDKKSIKLEELVDAFAAVLVPDEELPMRLIGALQRRGYALEDE